MKPSALAGVAAHVVGAITIGRSFNCDADEELLALSCLTGVLAAIWNDNAERGAGARIAKFLVLVFMVGMPSTSKRSWSTTASAEADEIAASVARPGLVPVV